MITAKTMITEIEIKLDDPDKNARVRALRELKKKADAGEIKQGIDRRFTNLHCHTFYSFNAYGYSPQHIIWRAFKENIKVIGLVDFDVLDCLEETLETGDLLGIKTVCGVETRVFFKEYADKVINSPGEPGIYYFICAGVYKKPDTGSPAEKTLVKLKKTAQERNLKVLGKINNFLGETAIDYEKDVLPLTPKGNATERHLIIAIDKKINEVFNNDTCKISSFWSKKLGIEKEKITALLEKPADLQEIIRKKLIKSGGAGYIMPEKENFPSLEEVTDMAKDIGALPCVTWLDGTTDGEKNAEGMLKMMAEKGAALLNIIPNRNWNIKDQKEKEIKTKNLRRVIEAARKLDLPVIAGTEMNKDGQKFVDDFESAELSSYAKDFYEGALFVYGHTKMGKLFNKGYNSQWARENIPSRIERNKFYIKEGQG